MLTVDEVIGRGSFGTVYRGRLETSDGLVRRVAVKVLSDEMSADSRAVARFRDEARLLALIDHPGLVPVYALERLDERWAVVMGYVDGFELAGAVRHGPLPPESVRQVGIQVAEILDALWTWPHPETGEPLHVVHRDVKPHNLMMDRRGRVRLLDLGVASARFEARETRTQAGEVAGTLAYMSPQRWARQDDQHKGDVYALGATLFQLATGKLPQEAGLHAVDHDQRLSGVDDVSEALMLWIRAAMSFEAEDRPDARELAEALRSIGSQPGSPPGDWARELLGEHPVRSSGLPDGLAPISFLGTHTLGTDTLLTTRYLEDEPTQESSGTRTLASEPTTFLEDAPAAPEPRPRWPWAVLAAVGIALGIAGIAWMSSGPSGPPISVALAPTDPTTVEQEHQVLRGWLEAELDRPISFVVADSYEHTGALLTGGEVAFASLPHRAGLLLMERDPGVRPLATKIIDGTESVDPYLIVRRDDPGKQLSDFLGGTVCYADVQSSTGYALPRAWIRSQGFDPDSDFAAHISGDHGQVLRDVIYGRCRLGGTFNRNLATAEQRGIPGSRLKVLAMTGESIPHDSWYTDDHTDPDLADRMADALIRFDPMKLTGEPTAGANERMSGFRKPPHTR